MIELVLFGKARLYMGRVWCEKEGSDCIFVCIIGTSVDEQF
jgi:hypothetical protein